MVSPGEGIFAMSRWPARAPARRAPAQPARSVVADWFRARAAEQAEQLAAKEAELEGEQIELDMIVAGAAAMGLRIPRRLRRAGH